MKLPRYFLDHWLRAFEKSRTDNHNMVTGFVTRLENALSDDSRSGATVVQKYQMGEGWRSRLDSGVSLWKMLTMIWQERRYLRAITKGKLRECMWLVADDRRTGMIHSWTALAQQISEFSQNKPPEWMNAWASDGNQLVCFTPNLLALRDDVPKDAVSHLSYISLFSVPLTWPIRYLVAVAGILAKHPLGALARRNTWITTLLAASLAVLLDRQCPKRLLMITSNSFVIELLRYMYEISGKGEGVTEVLHGVPTLELEAYHKNMVDFFPDYLSGRLTLVPPVPELRVSTAGGRIHVSSQAINLKMNTVSRQRDLFSLAEECEERAAARGNIQVVTLNGAGAVEGKSFINTGCFAAEQAILRYVVAETKRLNIRIHLQYSLHPAHIKSGIANAIRKELATYDVEVLDDSLQTWLESDLCISLLSSASWEAKLLGCDVVFGVSQDDMLYSSDLLSEFSYPSREVSIYEVLTTSLEKLPLRTMTSPTERVRHLVSPC
jgi:hypothetical protein